MVSKKPRIVIIGAGMAGLTAANKLHTSVSSFELTVVEGSDRIGGRIKTSSFCGDRIEQGATWIHGIEGSPVYKIARDSNYLESKQPWECMHGICDSPVTAAEGGHLLNSSLVDPISVLFQNLMDHVQGKSGEDENGRQEDLDLDLSSVGSFLRLGLEEYVAGEEDENGVGNWSKNALRRAIFAMHEGVQRTFTSAGDLCCLDYAAEKEYVMFPGDEVTIACGYSSVVESLASVLPVGMVQLGRQVVKIEWQPNGNGSDGYDNRPVKLHFSDGSIMSADHVIVTVSLGVLKQGIRQGFNLFSPELPGSKRQAITRLGYGVVNKVFLELEKNDDGFFPFLQMVFHDPDSDFRNPKIPNWIRKTSFLCPIYSNSRVVLSWFTGKEALDLESLTVEEIIAGFTTTVSNLLPSKSQQKMCCGSEVKFEKVLRTQWGTNPLFLGSYSYVAVGSSIDDMDTLAEPLPEINGVDSNSISNSIPPLQILFAGEATHKTHYSTTHGAYFSGLREANRLLKHYNYIGV